MFISKWKPSGDISHMRLKRQKMYKMRSDEQILNIFVYLSHGAERHSFYKCLDFDHFSFS